jgi:hypothetical protein
MLCRENRTHLGLERAAELQLRHADKIIIRDPKFEIPPYWDRIAGFDHGKTNPTAFSEPFFLRLRI